MRTIAGPGWPILGEFREDATPVWIEWHLALFVEGLMRIGERGRELSCRLST